MRVPTTDEVRAEVRAICKSSEFSGAGRIKQLLRYLVNETLCHPLRKPTIKAVTIAIDIFPTDSDPKCTNAKVTAGELRKRLRKYNETEGKNDRVAIEIPVRSYVPRFILNLAVPLLEMDNNALYRVSFLRLSMNERHGAGDMFADVMLGELEEKYPNHPQILSLYAMQHAVNATYDGHITPRKALQEAESLISKIREHDAEPWECTVTDAWVNATLRWDWQKADLLFSKAIAANPDAKTCHQWYPLFLASQLKLEEAEVVLQEAVFHTAYDRAVTRADLAFFQILSGKLDDAEESLRLAVSLASRGTNTADFPIGYGQTALLAALRGDYKGAICNLLHGSIKANHLFMGLFALFLGSFGKRDLAKQAYEQLKGDYFTGSALPLAFAALGIGDQDLALEWLTRAAVSDHDPWTILMPVHPLLRPLHSHSGFRLLVTEKMKLPFPDRVCT